MTIHHALHIHPFAFYKRFFFKKIGRSSTSLIHPTMDRKTSPLYNKAHPPLHFIVTLLSGK